MKTRNTCIVLAGGLATRMRHITGSIPKALIPIQNIPFVHYQLDWLVKNGVDHVVICIGYLGEQIRAYVGSGEKWNLKVSYVDEGKNLMGTGGAVRLAIRELELPESFFVTYGDSYLPIDLQRVLKFYQESPDFPVMTAYQNHGQWDTSNVVYKNGWVQLYDKLRRNTELHYNYIDYGLSILTQQSILSRVPAGQKYDLSEYFYGLSVDGKLRGFEATHRFYEIGSPNGLKDFTEYVRTDFTG